ncbi:MAG: METTL5 family protein [Thermoplasmatota archaeon]
MNGIKKKKLEIELAKIPPHPDPKVEWEQYTTPSPVAADILFTSYIKGDILNKTIIDLGCGTGIFSVGAATIGAKKVIGIDIDDKSITLAKEIAKKFELSNKIEFEVQDINRTNVTGDTVIMNPPFGAQKK